MPLASLEASFAIDEHLVAGDGQAKGRLWLHGPSLVPGMRDMRLPHAQEAVARFQARGYEVHLRSSGGRLVVLDEGVLNVAIAYAGADLPQIEPGFHLMADLIGQSLGSMGLQPLVGEVAGSICAGRYDLSLDGRKVAGLSQRRRRNFALIHAFLLVEGTGQSREELAADFYAAAGATSEESVRPGTMAALAEFHGDITVARASERLRAALDVL